MGELKESVEDVFIQAPKDGDGEISWYDTLYFLYDFFSFQIFVVLDCNCEFGECILF